MPYYGLFLSDMRGARYEESTQMAAWATTKQALIELWDSEKVEAYKTPKGYGGEEFTKSFRLGGPLEWCNPNAAQSNRDRVNDWGVIKVITFEPGDPNAHPAEEYIREIVTCAEYMVDAQKTWDRIIRESYQADAILGVVEAPPRLPADLVAPTRLDLEMDGEHVRQMLTAALGLGWPNTAAATTMDILRALKNAKRHLPIMTKCQECSFFKLDRSLVEMSLGFCHHPRAPKGDESSETDGDYPPPAWCPWNEHAAKQAGT